MKFFISLAVFWSFVILIITQEVMGRGRMLKGYPATEHQFPSVVHLEMKVGEDIYDCTGTIIDAKWIVTAAHCVLYSLKRPDLITIYMGSSYRNSNVKPVYVIPTNKNVIIHEHYNDGGLLCDDIALIKIERITQSDNIKIASSNYSSYQSYIGKTVKVVGYGSLTQAYNMPDIAQWNYFKVLKLESCEKQLQAKVCPGRQLCLYNRNGASSCSGDSGGPAYYGEVVLAAGSYVYREGCEHGKPMIYTYLPYYSNWMKKNMRKYN